VAPDLDARTAGGLRAHQLPLPFVGAELFIRAGAIVAEWLSMEPDGAMVVEAALKRAAAQASVLLQLYKLNAANPC
jgi:hypothetical protein